MRLSRCSCILLALGLCLALPPAALAEDAAQAVCAEGVTLRKTVVPTDSGWEVTLCVENAAEASPELDVVLLVGGADAAARDAVKAFVAALAAKKARATVQIIGVDGAPRVLVGPCALLTAEGALDVAGIDRLRNAMDKLWAPAEQGDWDAAATLAEECLRACAAPARYAVAVGGRAAVAGSARPFSVSPQDLPQTAQALCRPQQQVWVTETLAPGLVFSAIETQGGQAADGGNPPAELSPDGGTLTWRVGDWLPAGTVAKLTYRVEHTPAPPAAAVSRAAWQALQEDGTLATQAAAFPQGY